MTQMEIVIQNCPAGLEQAKTSLYIPPNSLFLLIVILQSVRRVYWLRKKISRWVYSIIYLISNLTIDLGPVDLVGLSKFNIIVIADNSTICFQYWHGIYLNSNSKRIYHCQTTLLPGKWQRSLSWDILLS